MVVRVTARVSLAHVSDVTLAVWFPVVVLATVVVSEGASPAATDPRWSDVAAKPVPVKFVARVGSVPNDEFCRNVNSKPVRASVRSCAATSALALVTPRCETPGGSEAFDWFPVSFVAFDCPLSFTHPLVVAAFGPVPPCWRGVLPGASAIAPPGDAAVVPVPTLPTPTAVESATRTATRRIRGWLWDAVAFTVLETSPRDRKNPELRFSGVAEAYRR